MGAHALKVIEIPAEVFHELAWQLNCVPFDAVNAGNFRLINARQQMMQGVASFVKQRDDVVMRERGVLTLQWWREVGDHMRDRCLDLFIQ